MKNSHSQTSSLHHCHVHKLQSILYTTHSLTHILALVAIFYFRATFFFDKADFYMVPFLPWLVIFGCEVLSSFVWLLKQPFYWRPVTRTAFPENLPKDEQQLPGLDVFICTADPNKEPTIDVMNTVISAMSLDYPAAKLSVYLSDDAGASVTLNGMKEAWVFATWWLPFCNKYNVKTICPRAYFQQSEEASQSSDFIEDRSIIKDKYEDFKLRVRSKSGSGESKTNVKDHPSFIQVINGNAIEDDTAIINKEHVAAMPSLVYVAREKRPSHPHHFKAGALNVLLRVSATMSNSPCILMLDCDMYCNDSTSARQAMCFYLDPKVSPTLGWVVFPQVFHNVNQNDIYDSQMRFIYKTFWHGADGLQGPGISGSNIYLNRKALYDCNNLYDGDKAKEAKDIYGLSNEFIKSLSKYDIPNEFNPRVTCSVSGEEIHSLASSAYETNTKWGQEVGFRYRTISEGVITGFTLQSKGWRSVFLDPTRPQFLGSATTNLNELLVQYTRWTAGILTMGLSRHCPLVYSPTKMHILQRISASWNTLFPLMSIPAWCFATFPLISFVYGIPLYPKVSDPFFIAFAYVFISSLLKLVCELMPLKGGSYSSTLTTLLNEERIWMIKWLTCIAYGAADCLMTKLGLREVSFILANKAEDDDTSKLYEMGKYDFRTSNMFLVPLVTAVSLNLCCLVGGIARLIAVGDWDSMFGQAFFSVYIFIMSLPVIEAMFLRHDVGFIPYSVTLKATLFVVGLLSFGYLFLFY